MGAKGRCGCIQRNDGKGTQTKERWLARKGVEEHCEKVVANWGGSSWGGKRLPSVSNTSVHRRPAALERSSVPTSTSLSTGDPSTCTMAASSASSSSVTVTPFLLQAGESTATADYDSSGSIPVMKAPRLQNRHEKSRQVFVMLEAALVSRDEWLASGAQDERVVDVGLHVHREIT